MAALFYIVFGVGRLLDKTSYLRLWGKPWWRIPSNELPNSRASQHQALFHLCPGASSVSPACHICPPSSSVPFSFLSQGSPVYLIQAATHSTLHGTQSQWYRAPLFHSLHLSLLFQRPLFAVPLYAWVTPNWAAQLKWKSSPCFPVS